MCTCTHPAAMHRAADGLCRMNGCPCLGYREPGAPASAEEGPRRVCVDVPDGYAVEIRLLPMVEGS